MANEVETVPTYGDGVAEATLARLAAEAEIRAVLVRYCRAVDRLDIPLLRTVYHDDATDDHGVYTGPVEGFYEFIAAQPQRGFEVTQHCLYQSMIELGGDVARVETYYVAYHGRRTDHGLLEEMTGARYLDRFERRDEWRIVHRKVVNDWSRVVPAPPTMWSAAELKGLPSRLTDPSAFTLGTRGPDDPSYTALAH